MAKLDITGLEEALFRLKEGYAAYQKFDGDNPILKEMLADSCIKRFEFTYETAKKTMDRFLKQYYDKFDPSMTIDDIFREMSGLGYLQNFSRWRTYRRVRNDTSHEYNQEKSYKVMDLIPQFIEDVDGLIASLHRTLEAEHD